VDVARYGTLDPAVASCVADVIEGLTFRLPEGPLSVHERPPEQRLTVAYSITFTPPKEPSEPPGVKVGQPALYFGVVGPTRMRSVVMLASGVAVGVAGLAVLIDGAAGSMGSNAKGSMIFGGAAGALVGITLTWEGAKQVPDLSSAPQVAVKASSPTLNVGVRGVAFGFRF
jgi:hypothetical protein